MSEATMLAPPEAFDDDMADDAARAECSRTWRPEELGRGSRTVKFRPARSCAGWVDPPRPEEFHDALRAERPTDRQALILRVWLSEGTDEDFIFAWMEGVYSFRQLVAAVHRAGAADESPSRNRYLNRMARFR